MTKASSLFDDIFKLQNTAPETDFDPEDPEDGFKASLIDKINSPEIVGTSVLRRKAAIIPDDPKYQGQKTSREDLYLEDEEDDTVESSESEDSHSTDTDEQQLEENEDRSNDDDGDLEDKSEVFDQTEKRRADNIVHPATQVDEDREKGKVLMYQLGLWDDLIKSRIALQKLVTLCNQLPQTETWSQFAQHQPFRQEANNVHSCVKKLVSSMLELQDQLQVSNMTGKQATGSADSDEEITSASDDEDEERNMKTSTDKQMLDDAVDNDDNETESSIEDDDDEPNLSTLREKQHSPGARAAGKHKLSDEEVEETMAKRHKQFQQYRNDTLSMWDEKTRLATGKIKAKNFSAFELSVLKQIEQILVNRERLVKRLHQQRTSYRILGNLSEISNKRQTDEDELVDDDDDDVEHKLQERKKVEVLVNDEIVDDNDFYHVCLRDLIMLRQNEETDPITSNKQWLEIQRLRNKQKQKVDTRASKGRKIRYNVKEKLKNYMTPYDKSEWSDEQKDDLFKALFGGSSGQSTTQVSREETTIRIGL